MNFIKTLHDKWNIMYFVVTVINPELLLLFEDSQANYNNGPYKQIVLPVQEVLTNCCV